MKKTEFQRRLEQAKKREARREQGLCVDCGKAPLAKKADGTDSVRCPTHFRTHTLNTDPVQDPGEDRTGGHFDQPEFHAYQDKVAEAVSTVSAALTKAARAASLDDEGPAGVSTRLIHEYLGDSARIHWTADALWMLKVAKRVRHSDTLPTRWYPVADASAGSPPYEGGVDAASADGVVLSDPPTTTGTTFAQADAECPPSGGNTTDRECAPKTMRAAA